MKRINQEQFRVILSALKGATPITFTAITEPDMYKKDNPFFGRIQKMFSANVMIGVIYENSVNTARAKEGNEEEFVAKPRKWGQRIHGTPLVEHKGQYYMETRFLNTPHSPTFFLDGKEIDKSLIAEWLKDSGSNAEHQGLEKEIIIRDYKLGNIKEAKLLGEHYVIVS